MSDRIEDLIKANMELAADEMRAILAREMFKSEGWPMFGRVYLQPEPRWRRILRRVRGYFYVLGLALVGKAEPERDDDDY